MANTKGPTWPKVTPGAATPGPGDSWDQDQGVQYQGSGKIEGMNIKPTGRLEPLLQIVQIRNQAARSGLISNVSKGSKEPEPRVEGWGVACVNYTCGFPFQR